MHINMYAIIRRTNIVVKLMQIRNFYTWLAINNMWYQHEYIMRMCFSTYRIWDNINVISNASSSCRYELICGTAKNKCILDEENTPDEFPSKLCSNDAFFLLRKEILCIRSLDLFTYLLHWLLVSKNSFKQNFQSSGRLLFNYLQLKNTENIKT